MIFSSFSATNKRDDHKVIFILANVTGECNWMSAQEKSKIKKFIYNKKKINAEKHTSDSTVTVDVISHSLAFALYFFFFFYWIYYTARFIYRLLSTASDRGKSTSNESSWQSSGCTRGRYFAFNFRFTNVHTFKYFIMQCRPQIYVRSHIIIVDLRALPREVHDARAFMYNWNASACSCE